MDGITGIIEVPPNPEDMIHVILAHKINKYFSGREDLSELPL
ncbi:MAG: hypothetical protein WCF01_01790 [Nitrososphaeraceae archaeon]